jgi:hypothetical protein
MMGFLGQGCVVIKFNFANTGSLCRQEEFLADNILRFSPNILKLGHGKQ